MRINKTQYFAPVPPEVWRFQVGGYQVCHKWLKDRKGRTLTAEDIAHYGCIVAALADTIDLMAEIDEVIENHGAGRKRSRWMLRMTDEGLPSSTDSDERDTGALSRV